MGQRPNGNNGGSPTDDPINDCCSDRDYLREILSDPKHPKHQAALQSLPRVLAEPKYATLGISSDDIREWLSEDLIGELPDKQRSRQNPL